MFLPVSALRSLNINDERPACDGATSFNSKEDKTEKIEDVSKEGEGIENETEHEEALFDPPLYRQRYSAVAKIINEVSAKSVIDMGCSEGQFITKIKDLCPKVEKCVGVDIDIVTLQTNSHRLKPFTFEYIMKRDTPLTLSLCNGSISDPDKRFCDADVVACIEVIEHLYEDVLEKVPHALFGVLKPKVAVVTTPNCEYNVVFKNFSGMRHWDHKFEWNREEFKSWCNDVVNRYCYDVEISGVGDPPSELEHIGYCSQMAVFTRQTTAMEVEDLDPRCCSCPRYFDNETNITRDNNTSCLSTHYTTVSEVVYPFDDCAKNRDQKIIHETEYIVNYFFSDISDETEEEFTREVSIKELLSFPGLKKFDITTDDFCDIVKGKYSCSADKSVMLVPMCLGDFSRDGWYGDEDGGLDDDYDIDGEEPLCAVCDTSEDGEVGTEDWDC